ncbi:MAG: hypothetical protein ACXABD_19395 [Candidatus Thorarchaeota archaeon]
MSCEEELKKAQDEVGRLLGILQNISRDARVVLSNQDPVAYRKVLEDIEAVARSVQRG